MLHPTVMLTADDSFICEHVHIATYRSAVYEYCSRHVSSVTVFARYLLLVRIRARVASSDVPYRLYEYVRTLRVKYRVLVPNGTRALNRP
eukprot:scaffold177855_cov19-Prasinocladus_malaysianus.AAC.1